MDWVDLGTKLSRYVRPATFPLAVKLVKPGETIPEKARKIRKNTTICQLLTIARRTGRTMYGGPEEFVCHGVMALGFADYTDCLLYTSPSPRDLSTSRMPSSA